MRVALVSCVDLPDWEVDDQPLVEALQARGVELARPAWDADFDWSAVDAALIRTTWDYTRRLPAFLAWAERAASETRLFNPVEVVRWNTRKSYLDELGADGVQVVPTHHLQAGDSGTLEGVLCERGWHRAFLKPLVGATAEATCRFDDPAVGAAFLAEQPAERPFLLQPYLPEVETRGEFSVVLVDGAASHGVRKVPVPGDYRVQDDFGATDAPWTPPPAALAVLEQVRAALERRFGVLLYTRLDLLHDPRWGWLVCEVEAVEPSLFLRHGPQTAERLASALLQRVGGRLSPGGR